MILIEGLTMAEASAVVAERNKAVPPIPGEHVGGGVHVPMPASWDGIGEVPPGWTGYHGPIEETDQALGKRGTYSVVIPDGVTVSAPAVASVVQKGKEDPEALAKVNELARKLKLAEYKEKADKESAFELKSEAEEKAK